MTQTNNDTIHWGLIGAGNIAHKFATDMAGVKGAKLCAVASRSQQKAAEFASQYGAERAYSSYEELASDPHIDAVYIATPHALHKDNTELCLKQGKAVLCEKPFAMNSDEVESMIGCAKANNALLMEALWTYFLPHYRFVLTELSNKTYGEIRKIEANFGFFRQFDQGSRLFDKSVGGGSLLDIGIYPVFAALSTLGSPEEINAGASFFENGADSTCSIVFNYENGVTATLQSTFLQDTSCEAIFHCERGTIRINRGFHSPTTVSLIDETGTRDIDFNYQTNGYSFEIEHFNELLRRGRTESDVMTFDFSRKLISTLDTIRGLIGLHY